MSLTVSDLAFEAGEWELARANLDPGGEPQLAGRQLIFRHLREAEFALGVGDEERAAECLEAAEPLVARSSEPQWIGAVRHAARRAARAASATLTRCAGRGLRARSTESSSAPTT